MRLHTILKKYTNLQLLMCLKLLKQVKTKHRNINITIIDELIKNFIIENEIKTDLEIKREIR